MLELVATPEDLVFGRKPAVGVADQILSDTLFTRADGSVVEVTRRVTPAQFEPGANLLVVAFWDRSEQLRVEGELERLLAEMRATLESTADGILVLDLDGGIRGYNHRFAELWQLPEHLVSERDDAGVLAWMEQGVSDPAGYRERLAAIQCSPLSEGTELVLLRGGRVLERVTLPQYARGPAYRAGIFVSGHQPAAGGRGASGTGGQGIRAQPGRHFRHRRQLPGHGGQSQF